MLNPSDVTDYWLNQIGPAGWYKMDEAIDADIRHRFLAAWAEARQGGYDSWKLRAGTLLPFLILLDQFPRNMFRGSATAFATDKMARSAAKKAIDKKWDMRVPEPERQFFYLPLMHSECQADQDRCVRLIKSRMPKYCEDILPHAKTHRDVIRKFGRFPYRNEALERNTTELEAVFLSQGGYVSALKAVSA